LAAALGKSGEASVFLAGLPAVPAVTLVINPGGAVGESVALAGACGIQDGARIDVLTAVGALAANIHLARGGARAAELQDVRVGAAQTEAHGVSIGADGLDADRGAL